MRLRGPLALGSLLALLEVAGAVREGRGLFYYD